MNEHKEMHETQADKTPVEDTPNEETLAPTDDGTNPPHDNNASTVHTLTEDDELATALQQMEDFRNALQRERADFQNFKKRIERENEGLRAKVSGDVLAKFLPVIDDFERAWEAIPEEQKDNDWMKGFNLIHRKFQSLIEAEGIVALNPLGEPFDPNYHEAIGADEPTEDIPSGHVTAVLQKGYQHGERVLRPALVRVAN
ncbi:MAG: nucleotide exchange factor GrpE [Anaerolineales bacterium]